ncbi:MAG TPA: hypothetical protein VM912_10155 [Terriglobales bacterium]|nr:hypothetical protein [Terriglobales bacterium]
MKKRRVSVLYRENCGGILRDLACGFRYLITNVAEWDLYDDLRERIFKQPPPEVLEHKRKLSA